MLLTSEWTIGGGGGLGAPRPRQTLSGMGKSESYVIGKCRVEKEEYRSAYVISP